MSEQIYEHHLSLKQDRLCPFKFKSSRNLRDSVCNWHANIEILLVTEGTGRVQYNADDLALEKHDIIVVNSGDLHRIYSNSGISFDYIIIDESFCEENGIHTGEYRYDRIFQCERIENICLYAHDRYKEYKSDPTEINIARLRLAVLELLVELCSQHSVHVSSVPSFQKSTQNYVKKVLEYVAEHYTEPVSLEEIANVCGITKYHLAREFKRYTGQTLITYVNILRCKKAEVCISEGMTVTEAAIECGFDSISYFSRTYKKLMGDIPSSKKSQ